MKELRRRGKIVALLYLVGVLCTVEMSSTLASTGEEGYVEETQVTQEPVTEDGKENAEETAPEQGEGVVTSEAEAQENITGTLEEGNKPENAPQEGALTEIPQENKDEALEESGMEDGNLEVETENPEITLPEQEEGADAFETKKIGNTMDSLQGENVMTEANTGEQGTVENEGIMFNPEAISTVNVVAEESKIVNVKGCVGDKFFLCDETIITDPNVISYRKSYSYTVVDGEENIQIDSETESLINRDGEVYGTRISYFIIFLHAGTACVEVYEKDNPESKKEFDYTITTVEGEPYVEYLVPESIKIGTEIGRDNPYFFSAIYVYHNFTTNDYDEYGVSDITENAFNTHFFVGTNYGGGSSWNYENRRYYDFGHVGTATKPGVFPIAAKRDEANPYNVVIEEPVINTNLPQEIEVGSQMQMTTSLDNTDLKNRKVAEVTYTNSDFGIAYEPKIEIISGADLVERSNGNFSNTLNTSENVKFTGEGIVVFKVVYEMFSEERMFPEGIGGLPIIFNEEAMYSPEATFTVNVVAEKPVEPEQPENKDIILDYTDGNLPTNEELLAAIQNAPESAKITINTQQSLILDSAILKEIANGQHSVTVNRYDKFDRLLYSWNIAITGDATNPWNTEISMGLEIPKLTQILNNLKFDGIRKTASYSHDGKLPGKASVKMYVGNDFKAGSNVYYYFFNETAGTFEKIGNYQVDENGYVTVDMEHCSDYVFTDKPIEVNEPGDNNSNNGTTTPDDNKDTTKPDETVTSPKTGESTKVLSWVFACIGSLGIAGIMLYLLNKKKKTL